MFFLRCWASPSVNPGFDALPLLSAVGVARISPRNSGTQSWKTSRHFWAQGDAWGPVLNPYCLPALIMLNILIIVYEDDMIFSKLWFSERGFWYCGKSPGQVNMSLGSQSQSCPFLDKSFTIAGPHYPYLHKNMDKISSRVSSGS